MRRFVAPLALAGLLASPIGSAAAQTNFTMNAQFSPATTVLYLPFHVTTSGSFQMTTSGLNRLDPMIRFYLGASHNGPGLGAFATLNDDGAPASAGWNACSGAGGTCHSFLNLFLNPGAYTLVMSVFDLTDAEARSGFATFGAGDLPPNTSYGNQPYCNVDQNWSDCNYDVSLMSQNGTAAVVPEPASMLLLGTGLAGLGGAYKRRRKNS